MNKEQKEVMQSQLNNEKRTLNELKQVYTQALKDCEKKIAELSSRRDMENLQSIIYQKQYQQALKGQLEGVLEQLHSNEFATVSDYLTRCYEDGYIGVMYDLQGQGIPVIVPIDQEAVTKAIQTDSKLSKPLYDRLGEDINKLKRSIRSEVSRGIANGSTWNQVAGKLAQSFKNTPFNSAYNRAMTIARTEGHRIQIQSADHAQHKAKEKGADIVRQWDATLDGKTRPHHRELDGKIRELDEPFEVGGTKVMYPGGFGDPAEDCNCRCALLQRAKWALDDAELNTLKERAEYFGLDKTKDFEDFKGKYLQASERVREGAQMMKEPLKQQYKNVDAMNEYDYYSEDQEQFRKNSIMELTGYDEEKAQEALEALCGSREKYLRMANSDSEYRFGWFYGEDTDIRNLANKGASDRAKIIDQYIKDAPSYDGWCYRGLALDDETISLLKNSRKFQENGVLSSWTNDNSVAEMFANGRSEETNKNPVIFRCNNIKDSTPVAHLSIYGNEENEVLVSNFSNGKFTIKEVTEENGITIFELSED